jgi:hypothetical protein
MLGITAPYSVQNMTEQSLSIKVPRYYNVSVTASCVFCKVGQTAIAFLEPGIIYKTLTRNVEVFFFVLM